MAQVSSSFYKAPSLHVPFTFMTPSSSSYDVIVIGGGASGTALLYILSTYTNLKRIALIEKYPTIGAVNSNAKNNSQTLHVGDIETNYTLEKAKQVKPAAMMVAEYTNRLPETERAAIVTKIQKMILAVGKDEVEQLEKRYQDLRELFPELQKLDAEGIRAKEPAVMNARDPQDPVLALFNTEGYAVNFGNLASSFVTHAKEASDKVVDVYLGQSVESITKDGLVHILHTDKGDVTGTVVIVDTDAYSLGFAKKMGYGQEFSLIPIAGTFYFSPKLLNGKVYTMQEPRMPFAAVHGDPDLTVTDATRWGPTARFFPVLESRKLKTMLPYLKSSGLHRPQTWASFFKILLEPIRFQYLAKNVLYELPYIGKYLFLPQVRKIVPGIKGSDLTRAGGYGGMRLQRVDTRTKELLLGEGKIIGENIIFNMTPSPGASVCLYNAIRDTDQIMKFFNGAFEFKKAEAVAALSPKMQEMTGKDVSLKESYSS